MMSVKCVYFLLIFTIRQAFCETSKVRWYESLIQEGIEKAKNYQLPSDAKMYEPRENQKINEYGSYDYVIIGSGTSGSIIASRLSEIENWSVLVLEAGNFSDNGFVQFPRYFPMHSSSQYSWGYESVPQSTACLGTVNKVCKIHQGKGVGGTSLINGVLYVRGHPDNYDNWAKIAEDPSWSYRNILKYFKKTEKFLWTNKKVPVDLQYHGNEGLLHVQHKVPNFFLTDVFINANKELGIGVTDYNSPKQLGSSVLQLYTKNGAREDIGSVFVTPFLNRKNLKVSTESYVTKIGINRLTKTANTVIFSKKGNTFKATAKKEIILAAGAVSTPQILMLSGIGPKNSLENLGIPPIQDLKVGGKLMDHPTSKALIFSTNVSLPSETLQEQIRDYLQGIGTLTAPTLSQALGFYSLNNTNNVAPNVEIISDLTQPTEIDKKFSGWSDDTYKAYWGKNENSIGFAIINVAPKSFGTIKLKSRDPYEHPLIDSKLLSDENNEDIDVMYEAIKLVFKLTQTQAYKRLNLRYLGEPLTRCRHLKFKTKEYWRCFLRQTTLTGYHPVGTCPMGVDAEKGAVVGSDLKVIGIEKLRIADASVFPTPVAGHPSVACLMVGEKVADEIKNEHLEVCPRY
ncbi:unnamed protein product [Phyllotreta striolata]|uniref:Glucose-methanol-choline oxidoreductase N-terminal domain-containing protein n=1 Tax=Phyllotreta striolata TaxID=444603 RepID=A0A9P0E153_PHYSR|nr:unnamed protein product [Phyllotreta striolata]